MERSLNLLLSFSILLLIGCDLMSARASSGTSDETTIEHPCAPTSVDLCTAEHHHASLTPWSTSVIGLGFFLTGVTEIEVEDFEFSASKKYSQSTHLFSATFCALVVGCFLLSFKKGLAFVRAFRCIPFNRSHIALGVIRI